LKSNDYFGDLAIESNIPRNENIIVEEDIDITCLSNKLYKLYFSQIATEKAIVLQNRIQKCTSKFFYIKFSIISFQKNILIGL
jgi:hypothetical protein